MGGFRGVGVYGEGCLLCGSGRGQSGAGRLRSWLLLFRLLACPLGRHTPTCSMGDEGLSSLAKLKPHPPLMPRRAHRSQHLSCPAARATSSRRHQTAGYPVPLLHVQSRLVRGWGVGVEGGGSGSGESEGRGPGGMAGRRLEGAGRLLCTCPASHRRSCALASPLHSAAAPDPRSHPAMPCHLCFGRSTRP
mgnify:CR=1 FL=1